MIAINFHGTCNKAKRWDFSMIITNLFTPPKSLTHARRLPSRFYVIFCVFQGCLAECSSWIFAQAPPGSDAGAAGKLARSHAGHAEVHCTRNYPLAIAQFSRILPNSLFLSGRHWGASVFRLRNCRLQLGESTNSSKML